MEKDIRVASHGLIQKGGKFLVTKRVSDKNFMPDLWDTPGGRIKFGEHSIDALIREIDEETKIKVKVGDLIFVYDFTFGLNIHSFQLVFKCDYLSGEVVLNPNEHSEYKWVTLDELKSLDKIAFLDELSKTFR